MSKELYTKICGDLKNRSQWENKQRVWYEMRHQGLRRKNKPYPGASDLHFPLVDSIIEKTKPFYAQQLVSTELLASFVALKHQSADLTSAAAQWFDYKLRYQSDFIIETLFCVDHMLQSNKGILKLYWDHDAKRLGCDAIEPIAIIVPASTKALKDADRITHVMTMSVEEYKRNTRYKQNADFIKRITGKPADANGTDAAIEQERLRREGITEPEDGESIILWEVYERGKDGITVSTFSPNAPNEPARAPFQLTYKHGRLPFIEFHMEIKGKGYYDPRGVTEIVAPYEASTCKMWNQKHDFMDFVNRPLFTSEREIPNAGNFSLRPGMIVPFGLSRVDLGNPPFALDQEIAFNRATAEQRIGQPDYAMQRPGPRGGSDPRTAKEVEMVGAMSMQSTDMRAIIFRIQLTEGFEQAWSLYLQFDQEAQFLVSGKISELPPAARHEAYQIKPSGNVDSWNKSQQAQKAWTRFQMFKDDPFINQGELRKSVLVLDSPDLVEQLYQDPGITEQDEYEDEVYEICAMLTGWPARVRETDNHTARLRCLAQFMQKRAMKGEPITDPETLQILEQHAAQHREMLQAQDPKGAKQLDGELQQLMGQTQGQLAQMQNAAPNPYQEQPLQ